MSARSPRALSGDSSLLSGRYGREPGCCFEADATANSLERSLAPLHLERPIGQPLDAARRAHGGMALRPGHHHEQQLVRAAEVAERRDALDHLEGVLVHEAASQRLARCVCARKRKVQYLMDMGIPLYLCSIEEFAQLASLAQERGTVPEHTRGTCSIQRGLEFFHQTRTFEDEDIRTRSTPARGRSRLFSPRPAATQLLKENPPIQRGYGPLSEEGPSGDSDGQWCQRLFRHSPPFCKAALCQPEREAHQLS